MVYCNAAFVTLKCIFNLFNVCGLSQFTIAGVKCSELTYIDSIIVPLISYFCYEYCKTVGIGGIVNGSVQAVSLFVNNKQ